MISKIIKAFNSYEGTGTIGNTSQMITSKSKALIKVSYKEDIYIGEFKVTS